MAIEIRELREGNFESWDNFVETSPHANIFSSSRWKKIIEDSTLYKGKILAFFRANEIVAGCLLFSIKKGPFEIIYQPPLTPFTTLLFEQKKTNKLSKTESFEKEIIEKLDEIVNRYSYAFLVMHPMIKDIRPFTFRKWQSKVNYTYLIDISDIKKLWENVDKAAKYDIKKAGEMGLEVTVSDDVGSFYSIYKKTFERQGLKKFPSKNLVENILKIKNSRLYVVKKTDKIIAGAVVILDKNVAYYLLAASDPDYRESGQRLC